MTPIKILPGRNIAPIIALAIVSIVVVSVLRAAPALEVPLIVPATVYASMLDEAEEQRQAGLTIGPEKSVNNCSSCHALEAEAWRQTRHFATFKEQHRSDRAKQILANMGQKSMKRAGDCRQCHYTSVLKKDKLRATWGVSCESCHGPGQQWNDIHGKPGGDPGKPALVWGSGKSESKGQRAARLEAAKAKGMIHSEMIYEIATNCFGCHSVPNEELVNKGNHLAGSDFDLVAWSQGEIRHNFVSSAGAPDSPTNRPATPEQRRRLYVVGAAVDLEFTLRNLVNVSDKGGTYHKAMIGRANRALDKLAKIVAAAGDQLPGLATAVKSVPTVDESTKIDIQLANAVGKAARKFAASQDGTKLAAIDSQIPTQVKGQAHKE